MIEQEINTSLFTRLRFVLIGTSHPGNIGAVARAIKTMGFGELVLVKPRFDDALQQAEAIAFASGAQDVLNATRVVETVEEALLGCNFAAAVSARLREFSPPITTPRAFANQIASQIASNTSLQAAIIFGNERYGLPNEVVQNCNVLVNIPANPDYSSLNLAQAVQVLAYEARLAALDAGAVPEKNAAPRPGFQGETASLEQIEGMYEHLQQGLVAIEFLNAENPKKLMPRLKRLFGRTQLETEEVNILRGIARQMQVFGKKRD